MPFYHRLGQIPRVKHTTFYKKDGRSLYREELVSSKGFSGIYSTKYRLSMPTAMESSRELTLHKEVDWPEAQVLYYHFFTDRLEAGGDFISGRNVFLQNGGCTISTARPTEDTDAFFRNIYASEYIFVHHGKGKLTSDYGVVPFGEGDQLIIPR